MSDSIAPANDYTALMLARQRAVTRHTMITVSAFICEDCDAPIYEARRKAMMGCWLCADCQTIAELKSRHYRSV